MERCLVVGGSADRETIDVPEDVFIMRHKGTETLYRKEYIQVKNRAGEPVNIPFLLEKELSTYSALRKIFFSYRKNK